MRGYTTREVADVLGVPSSRILAWTRRGLLSPLRGPRGAYVFSFQDVALLRASRELVDDRVSVRKLAAALEALREQLPRGRPLSAVTLTASGDRLLVRDGDAVWEPDSGQHRIDFSATAMADADAPAVRGAQAGDADAPAVRRTEAGDAEAPPVRGAQVRDADLPTIRRARSVSADDAPSADDWFDAAVDLEAVSTDDAVAAYRRALELDPGHSDAHLNLGRLLHEEGRLDEAETHYRRAANADPRSARAFYNLGVALEDRSAVSGAVEAYEAALRLDPELAVAHFNLSRLLEADGRSAEALAHLAAYKKILDRGGIGA